MSKTRFVCIVGPTASGKTELSVLLAKKLSTEIVSADSMQVYKYLNIGSAKPTLEEMQGVRHHLMDCIEPDKKGYSVSEYMTLAKNAIQDISDRGMLPIVVGGTGLYINSLTFPLQFADVKADDVLRKELQQMEQETPGKLYDMLCEIDIVTAQRLHRNDIKRIIRAIEVYRLSGKPLSEHGNDFTNERGLEMDVEPIMIGISMPRSILYERIEKRVDIMLEQGLVDETCQLMKMDSFDEGLPSMQGLGYKQLIQHFLHNDPATLEETVARIKLETRHFAKRQLTWFRRDKRICWIDVSEFSNKDDIVEAMYNVIRRI